MSAAIKACDLVIIPCSPTFFDVHESATIVKFVKHELEALSVWDKDNIKGVINKNIT